MRRSWPLVLWLTVVWVGLWGSISWANVLGGLAIGVVLVAVLPLAPIDDRAVVRPWGLVRLLAFFAVDLVRASVQVVVLALRPRPVLRQAIVAVPVRGASDRLLTLVANAISLTPGTLTVEVDRDGPTLYVHAIDVGAGPGGADRVRASVRQLERLAVLAVGSPRARAAFAEDERLRAGTPGAGGGAR